MGRVEATLAVGRLVAAFRQDDIRAETVECYVDGLSDIDGDLLGASVQHVVATSKFFPAVSELRHEAARLAGLLPISKAEAIAVIRRADVSESKFRRDGSYAYTERYWQWPEDVDPTSLVLIQAALAKVGEPVNSDGKAHFGWEMGFQDCYERDSVEVSKSVLAYLSRARLLESKQKQLT